ncbi:MAG: aminotransferase class III-fold pyridoxal phosphate-dependent enzyme [Acidobacteriota bacterium]
MVEREQHLPSSAYLAYGRHVNPPLAQFLSLSGRDQHFVKAAGCYLITDQGESYADWIAGMGSLNLGHNHPRLIDCITKHISAGTPNLFIENLNPFAGMLAKQLVHSLGEDFATCFFSNSGTEAVEAAIKLAIAATGRRMIVYCQDGYHGTTLGALSMMAQGVYRERFEPLLPSFQAIPFGDLAALQTALSEQPAAFVLEPIQIEAGLRILPHGFLAAAKAMCREQGTLLVLDEVQTGLGRTGSLCAFQQEGAAPDILVLAKSLGGGLVPIGAMVAGPGLFARAYGDYRACEIHNSTFGGNALACQVALATLSIIEQRDFLVTVSERGEQLNHLLTNTLSEHPLVAGITMRGLLGGIKLRDLDHPWFSWQNLGIDDFANMPIVGPLLVHRMYRRKVLVQVCGHDWNTIRIEPPLIVSEPECETFVAILKEQLDWIYENG